MRTRKMFRDKTKTSGQEGVAMLRCIRSCVPYAVESAKLIYTMSSCALRLDLERAMTSSRPW
jgi:hypothetical protein